MFNQQESSSSTTAFAFKFTEGKFYATDFLFVNNTVSAYHTRSSGIAYALYMPDAVKFREGSIFMFSDNTLVAQRGSATEEAVATAWRLRSRMFDGSYLVIPSGNFGTVRGQVDLQLEQSQSLQLADSVSPEMDLQVSASTPMSLGLSNVSLNTIILQDSNFTGSGSGFELNACSLTGSVSILETTFVDASAHFTGNNIAVASTATLAAIYFKNSPLNDSSTVTYVNNTITLNNSVTTVAVLHDSGSQCAAPESITFADNVFEAIVNGTTATATVEVPVSCSLCPTGSCASGRSAVEPSSAASLDSIVETTSSGVPIALTALIIATVSIALIAVLAVAVVRRVRSSAKRSVRIDVASLEDQVDLKPEVGTNRSSLYMESKPQEVASIPVEEGEVVDSTEI